MSESGAGEPTGADVEIDDEVANELDENIDETTDDAHVADADEDWVVLGGDASLDLSQVNEIAAEMGATIVLVAGNQEAGKTTLLVALYDQFLFGQFGGMSFVESKTLDAFDGRQFGSRVESGNDRPKMERTEEREMRFLHLRLAAADGTQKVLLPTDVWGEVFEELANGTDVVANIPIATRIDKTVILIDGEEVASPTARQTAEKQATLMMGALLDNGGLEHSAPLLIALSKADAVKGDAAAWYDKCAERLKSFAIARGAVTVETTKFAAAPKDGTDPSGLVEVFQWMLADIGRPAAVKATRTVESDRVFLSSAWMSR